MNKTIVIITGIIVAGLLIGYYLYLNKGGNVAQQSLKGNTQLLELVESYAYDSKYTVKETIDNKLHGFKGDFKIIGWERKRIDEQTLLASYMYRKNGKTVGWFFEVKSGRLIRDVSKDGELMKKYNVVNKTVFTEEDMAKLTSLSKRNNEIRINEISKNENKKSRIVFESLSEYESEIYRYLSSEEQKIFKTLNRKRNEYNEGILMLKQE
jgi:hypothetical protein